MLIFFLRSLINLLPSIPCLQTLEILFVSRVVRACPELMELDELDEYIQGSQPSSLQRLIFKNQREFGGRGWDAFKDQVNTCMPYCSKEGMIEFITCSFGRRNA